MDVLKAQLQKDQVKATRELKEFKTHKQEQYEALELKREEQIFELVFLFGGLYFLFAFFRREANIRNLEKENRELSEYGAKLKKELEIKQCEHIELTTNFDKIEEKQQIKEYLLGDTLHRLEEVFFFSFFFLVEFFY